ncbi:hypothetical protein [uncultured Mediterranean phage uvMED]|nr:hypothetical protein [uncultured Mediterranean phage uvMED]
MNVNVNHNEPPLTTLVDQWQALKQAEEKARLARVAHEALMLPYLEQVPQGSKTTTLSDGRKVTVKNGDSYSVDWQAWKQVKNDIPDELKPVQLKEVLSETKLRYLMNNEVDTYKAIAKCFVARPQKAGITVKEAPHGV